MGNEQTPQVIQKMPSGIAGLDEVTAGGLPRGGITVVLGGAGSGKTTFGLQVLANGARARQEPGILVAFEESAERILANSAGFEWGGEALHNSPVHVLDAQLSQSVEQSGEFDLVGFLAMLGAQAKQLGARRIVFDGIDVLLAYLDNAELRRREVFRLRDWVYQSGLSAIITAKGYSTETRPAAAYDFLQFMADCVVTMHNRIAQGTSLRFLRVSKYRGSEHSANELPLTISRAGLEVASHTAGERAYPASRERVSSGVARLDAMLAGGYHRGSSVLITGAPGTAKTSLCASFIQAAARRGERVVYVSFDEAPEQILRNAASIGIELRPYVEAGTLRIHSLRARSEGPEGHVARIRALLHESSPQNLVIDPLSAMTQLGCEAEAEAAALQILDVAKSAGITIVSTSLLGNLLPLIEHTPFKVSTIADTWMHVSYDSRGGERNRALTVIKSRGTAHSNQVRELTIGEAGVSLTDVYSVGGEVLMGTLRWQRENDARRARVVAQNGAVLRERKAELALAGMTARLEALVRERAIQEAELELIRTEAAAEVGFLAQEDDEMLARRRVDPSTPPPARIAADLPGSLRP